MSASNLAGRTVDRYDVGEQLGQGGFGAVYRARHRIVGNVVALKVLWPDHADDPAKVERFLQEARAAAAVGSEHIVRVFDAGQTPEGIAFLALELLEGHDLEKEIELRGALPIDESVAIVSEILAGLSAAHACGIVHRDLKPGNVFLAKAERGRRVKILDFGISKIIGAKTLTAAGTILGTPQYMAPEQLAGTTLDHRADLYAAGTILYELLSGRVPIEGAGYEVIVERVQGRRPPDLRGVAPQVPVGLADVVMRALALDPDARWRDAAAMQEALRIATLDRPLRIGSSPTMKAPSKPPPSLPPPSLPPPSLPPPSRPSTEMLARSAPLTPLAVGGLGGLAVLLAIGLGVLGVLGYRLLTKPGPEPERPPTTNAIPVPIDEPEAETIPVPVPLPVPLPDVEPTEAPVPAPTPPALPRWNALSYAGTGSRTAVESLISQAMPQTQRCYLDRPVRVIVNVIISGSAVRLAQHDPSQRSDDTGAADCVGDVIRQHGSIPFGPTESAVITIAVELPPR